ncbi:MAG TPA: AAA family ATPase [Streptosporangiaceae bacterium]|nr:AAA family ATPase [Streptosporangiaceae bacterium]
MAFDPPRRTLAARLEDRDRGRFAGRETELAFLDRCMEADPPASVVHICGPGGIGKSALLRAAARRARAIGWEVVSVDGRELGPASAVLEAVVRKAARMRKGARGGGPLILLDSYERISSLDGYLRRDLLPTLPDRALVLIAGRGEPDAGWFSGGWETVTARLELHGLDEQDALRLLFAHGLSDERVPVIIDWARGSPLALSLAADTASADAAWNAETDLQRPEVLRSLIHRLAHSELRDVRMSALCVAALARTTTPQLLSAVLPRGEGESAYAQLCELTVAEPLGDGVTLHDLVRKALLADLRLRNQEFERFLRRRIIDYLYELAADDQPLLIIDMAHLVEDPLMKWGFGWEGDVGYRVDSVRDYDIARLEHELKVSQNVDWWHLTSRFFTDSPDRVAVVRDVKDNIRGYMACMSLATAPGFAWRDPLIGPWLAHAREHAGEGESVLWHAAVDLTGQGKVQAMLGVAGVLRCGVVNPRFAYLPIDPSYPGALAFAQAIGAEHHTELDVEVGGMLVECHRLDYGPGGLNAFIRAQVYAEIGLPKPGSEPVLRPTAPGTPAVTPILAIDEAATTIPAAPMRPAATGATGATGALGQAMPVTPDLQPRAPARVPRFIPAQLARANTTRPNPGSGGPAESPSVDIQIVRDALKNFRVPRDLARSPLAVGDTVAERAESVRRLINEAAQGAFGDSETEKLLRSVLIAGYLEPMRSHEEAASKLLLSRAAYFRRLRTAVERLTEHLVEQLTIGTARLRQRPLDGPKVAPQRPGCPKGGPSDRASVPGPPSTTR